MVVRYVHGLTKRELEAVGHVCRGLCNKEVAWEMHISPHTVRCTLVNVYAKLNIHTRYELLMWAIDRGLFKRKELEAVEQQIFDGAMSARLQ
jgi:DNA-binding CsgD family transcriptional regulator